MEVDPPHLLHEARQVINEERNKPNEEVETSQLIHGFSFSFSSHNIVRYSSSNLNHHPVREFSPVKKNIGYLRICSFITKLDWLEVVVDVVASLLLLV